MVCSSDLASLPGCHGCGFLFCFVLYVVLGMESRALYILVLSQVPAPVSIVIAFFSSIGVNTWGRSEGWIVCAASGLDSSCLTAGQQVDRSQVKD
jgi:hypothetical protein